MSTTIDSLNIQIEASAGQATAKINALATALGNLKSNSKITTTVNGLNKLSTALNTLNPALGNLNVGKLNSLRGTLIGLGNITKLSGLNSALNTLKKLPEIINGLDDAALTQFTNQMNRLAKALEPVATRINAVGTAFAALPANLRRAVTAVDRVGNSVNDLGSALNSGAINLASFTTAFNNLIGYANQLIAMMGQVISVAIEWDGIQYRFGRAFGEDAEEVYNHMLRINEVMGISTQELMDYSSLYGSLLKGFGVSQDKVTTMSVGLTELSYDIWAAYNGRYKTLEDAAEAVRSAITGEIEPIRNAGIALTEASLQEYLESVGMAKVSIEKLSEAQKTEVRYAAMVNAAMNQGIIGTYAAEMHTAEGAVRGFRQNLKTLSQSFGGLFIPVLQAVIPYLSAFVQLLTEAVHWIAQLFGVKLFEIDWSSSAGGVSDLAVGAGAATDNLKDAAGAAKKLKDYTMGFDELNVIEPPKETGGAGGGGAGGAGDWGDGLGLDRLWDDAIFEKASQQVNELKEKMRGVWEEWKDEILIVSSLLGILGISKLLGHLGEALYLGDKFTGVLKGISKLAVAGIIVTLQYSIQTELFKGYIDGEGFKKYLLALFTGAIGTGVLYSMFGPTGIVIGLGVTAAASLTAVFENGGITNVESAATALTGFASAAGAIAVIMKTTDLDAAAIASTATTWVTGTLVPAVTGAITTGLTAVASALGVSVGWAVAIVAAIVAAIVGAIWVATHWDEVKEFFTTTVPEWFSGVKQAVTEWWTNFDIGKTIRNAMGKVESWFAGIRDDVKKFWDGVVKDIKNVDWKGLGKETGKRVGEAFANAKEWFIGIKDAVETFFTDDLPRFFKEDVPRFFKETIPKVIEDISKSWDKFWKESVPKFLDKMVNFFLIEIPTWKKKMKEIGVDIIMGVLNGIQESWTEFWKGVGKWIDGFVEGFKEALDIHSPSGVFADIGKEIIAGLLNGISKKWEELKSWYNRTVASKFTTEYWKTTFDTIVTALKTKLDEAWTKVTNFFSIEEWKKKVVAAMGAIKDNFKIPNLPTFDLSVTWDTDVGAVKKTLYKALGLQGWPKLSWKTLTYADGGFPPMGSMFIASEAGPELVGRIGNRTAVANNDQIVSAVSQGVYSAVRAAMSGEGGNGQNVNVYLDGRQITAAVEKRQYERGLTLMGRQVGYGY